ncbi:hypothetical protein ACJX0J_030565, partial [Zea mays]
YISEFEYLDDHRGGKIVMELNGRLNKCGVISPRFDVGVKEIEGWTTRLLPSRQFGYIVLTTYVGIMDHEEARRLSEFDLARQQEDPGHASNADQILGVPVTGYADKSQQPKPCFSPVISNYSQFNSLERSRFR